MGRGASRGTARAVFISIPAARTARKYFETAPIDRSSARAIARTLKLLACRAISCFSFDMETLSFGIDLAPVGQKPQGYALDPPIISSRRLAPP